jgi:hypothetical protein
MTEQQTGGSTRPRGRTPLGLLAVHYGLYGVANLALLTINVLTSPGNWWFLWIVWGWGMLVAAHAGLVFGGFLGADAALVIVLNLGLLIVNLIYSEDLWFYWPLSASAVLLALHVLFAKGVASRVMEWSFGEDPAERGGAGSS